MITLWVYGWWFCAQDWAEAVKKSEAIGKPVKAAIGGTPIDSAILYTPTTGGGGTYA